MNHRKTIVLTLTVSYESESNREAEPLEADSVLLLSASYALSRPASQLGTALSAAVRGALAPLSDMALPAEHILLETRVETAPEFRLAEPKPLKIRLSANGKLLQADDEWLEATGYAANEIEKLGFLELVNREGHLLFLERYIKLSAGEAANGLAMELTTKTGRALAVRANFTPVLSEGRLQAIEAEFVLAQPLIIERVSVQKEPVEAPTAPDPENQTLRERIEQLTQILQKSEEAQKQLALLADLTDNAVLVTDTQGAIRWANRGFERLSGYLLHEIVGRRQADFLHGADTDPETVARIGKNLSEQEPVAEELLHYDKRGNAYWIALRIAPMFDDDGVLTGFFVIQSELTEQRAQAARLEETQRRLQTAIAELQNARPQVGD